MPYACFGIVTKNNTVIDAPPIAIWTIGKDINFVLNYYKNKKKGEVIKVKNKLKVFTSQYKYQGQDRFDITVKTGDKTFAPTWKMVIDYKLGKISQEEYIKQYYDLMRESYIKNKNKWDILLNKNKICLICFCKKGDFCHRLILAEILVKLGAEYLGEI